LFAGSVIELPRIPAYYPKEKTSAQRQKRKKTLLGRPIFTLNLYSLVAVLRNQGRCFLSVIPSS
ncbi:hypothetical protein, partial [Blautia wexlerae]|uniref:hypothetical protein n=1 Tax=Blautia wexlerae TaxID=418240 RepID=UPI001A9ABEF9